MNSIVSLKDAFHEGGKLNLIVEQPDCSLRETVLQLGKKQLKEAEVRKCVHQLLLIVKDLQRKRIKHGRISLETVFTKRRSKGLELKLGGLDLAKILKKPGAPDQPSHYKGLSSAVKLAKKVDDTVSLELTDDVYDVGMIAFYLLDGVLESQELFEASVANFSVEVTEQAFQSNHWQEVSDQCKELLTFMVQEDQRMRFTIDQVLRHPWINFD